MTDSALPPDMKPQPRNVVGTIELLETTKWADDLSRNQVEILAGYFQIFTAEKGSVIVREGSREVYLCLLVDGKVQVMKEGDRHATTSLTSVGPGKTFGEMS